jgi:hypothetical protein
MKCNICDKTFHYKRNFELHTPTCEYLHKTRQERHEEEDHEEAVPTTSEVFKLLQFVIQQNNQLREEIIHLKQTRNQRSSTCITQQIAQLTKTTPPNKTFQEWLQTFQPQYQHLEVVFKQDLYDGIQKCLVERIQTEPKENTPIRRSQPQEAQQQQQQHRQYLFVYDQNKQWVVCDKQYLNSILNSLVLKMEMKFLEWDSQYVPTTEEEKEQYNFNMLKIEGKYFRRHFEHYRNTLRQTLLHQLSSP